jgi:putative ATP-dependent endonuclease of OLD family
MVTHIQWIIYKACPKRLEVFRKPHNKGKFIFAKGIIIVEGWAEEIIPSISKNIGINLTEKGVSIVNAGSLAYNRYAKKIFLRKESPLMSIPIAILDSDVREYDKVKVEESLSIRKKGKQR